MASLYPLIFQPLPKERVWGGRNLERLFQKSLPPEVPIGESWDIADRPDAVSVLLNGPLAGRSLRWLMEHHGDALLGQAKPMDGRFPLLVKWLDAQDVLSLQVHPPAAIAATLGGQPKTEMWYVCEAKPEAEVFMGLRHGVTREEFERRLSLGTVADCFHRVKVRKGDTVFLPSGRVHALGAGLVLCEIQQNSDTTYRVFDWNRRGLDGHRRELHVPQALASIDFQDFSPGLVPGAWPSGAALVKVKVLVYDPAFWVDLVAAESTRSFTLDPPRLKPLVLAVIEGRLRLSGGGETVNLEPGCCCLVPARLEGVIAQADVATQFLRAQPE